MFVILNLILIRLQHVCTCQKFAYVRLQGKTLHTHTPPPSVQTLSSSSNCLKVNASHTPINHTAGNLSIFSVAHFLDTFTFPPCLPPFFRFPFDWHAINIKPTAISTANFVNNVSPESSGINLSTCPSSWPSPPRVMHNSQTSPG